MDNQLHTISIYNKHVKEYVEKFMNLDLYKDTFDYFLEQVPSNGTVLELGCGPGNVVKYLKSKRADLDVLGIDLAPGMIEEAQRQNPDARFALMDIRNIDQIKQKYSAIVAAFCLPYIAYSDTCALFRNINMLTSSNSLLYLSCMEGTRERSGFEKTSFTGDSEMYISYYGREEIASWLEEHNFTIEAFYTKDYSETDGSITTDIIYTARKSKVAE